jgi:hypothetical protein
MFPRCLTIIGIPLKGVPVRDPRSGLGNPEITHFLIFVPKYRESLSLPRWNVSYSILTTVGQGAIIPFLRTLWHTDGPQETGEKGE